MKILQVFALVLAGFIGIADAATPQQRRGNSAATAAPVATAPAGTATNARAATRNTTARNPNATSAASTATNARAATRNTAVRNTSATSTTGAAVSTGARAGAARAGATQKVINNGTKVATAAQNTAVSEECKQKYDGCMDAFCMLDNASGGRCICSNKNAEYNDILAEIEKLDEQSYQMATAGVERLEMGADADAAIAAADAAAQAVIDKSDEKKTANRRTLDLALWNVNYDDYDLNIFSDAEQNNPLSAIEGKEGDALHSAAAKICREQIPECASEMSLLQTVYAQRVRNDCLAYENSLKQQRQASAQKLAAAQQALRQTALEQYRNANKYDLGQCTVEFKKCMATTAGCGEDFTACVSLTAAENMRTTAGTSTKAKADKQYTIKGAASSITIAASTYDTLDAKKPLCMSVTNSCVAVKDQVWDTFLKEVAPQIKSAELSAESDLRMSCISTISDCFQQACKDTMDPNDPDGSYDMCLTRPETLAHLCKVQLDPCVAATGGNPGNYQESVLWDFVVARLASMRVDSCTKEVKECLTADDRCGKDYTQCIGLDTDTIVKMCPYDKLVGCQQVYGDTEIRGNDVYDAIATMVEGVFLNIDNNMLTACQKAADNAMVKVCGDTANCDGLTTDDNIGARSLEYKICEYRSDGSALSDTCYANAAQVPDSKLGRISNGEVSQVKAFAEKIEGQIAWELLDFDENGMLINLDQAIEKHGDAISQEQRNKMKSELSVVNNSIKMAIDAIESDPEVQYCMTGRQVQGIDGRNIGDRGDEKGSNRVRFPSLTKQMRMLIAESAIKIARDNYYKKYDSLKTEADKALVELAGRAAENANLNKLDARREIARQSCVNYSRQSTIGKKASDWESGVIAPEKGCAGGIMVGSDTVNERSYKETITSTFNCETLVCHRCIRKQSCAKMKKKNCRTWGEENETCNDISF